MSISIDSDNDKIPDSWETDHFGELVEPDDDPDLDDQSNLQEFIAGTDPTENSSYFAVEAFGPPTLSWNAIDGRTYTIFRSESLNEPFVEIAKVTNSPFYDASATSEQTCYFYRITAALTE